MKYYRFVFSPRWMGYLLLAAIFAAACTALGFWQLGRRDEVLQSIAVVKNNYSAPAVDYASASSWMKDYDPTKQWRPVSVRGHYLSEQTRIVRNRVNNSSPGYDVIVPFQTTSGDVIAVDRGWLPIGDKKEGYPDSVPPPPAGQVQLVGRIKPSEPVLNRGAPAGQIATINLPLLSSEVHLNVDTGAYLLMESESPSSSVTPTPYPQPSIDEGPHLSYAFQWFAFGVMFFVGWGYLVRQQAKQDREDERAMAEGEMPEEFEHLEQLGKSPAVAAALARSRYRKTAKVGAAEAEEDALLDAVGYEGGTDLRG